VKFSQAGTRYHANKRLANDHVMIGCARKLRELRCSSICSDSNDSLQLFGRMRYPEDEDEE